jgi:hypothetical protein
VEKAGKKRAKSGKKRCGERGVPMLWRSEENRGKGREEEGKRQGFQQGVLLVEKQLDEREDLRT